MFADGFLHDNEINLFNAVCTRFEIDDEDVRDMKKHLLEAIDKFDKQPRA
jgi:hypothetical protein